MVLLCNLHVKVNVEEENRVCLEELKVCMSGKGKKFGKVTIRVKFS
jgi:hypothetical protein